jgi:hypothetical protein
MDLYLGKRETARFGFSPGGRPLVGLSLPLSRDLPRGGLPIIDGGGRDGRQARLMPVVSLA